MVAARPARRLRDNPERTTGGTSDVGRGRRPHSDHEPATHKEAAVKKTLVAGLVVVLTSAIGTTAAGAGTPGTTNGNAGCVAQVNTVEGTPGQSIDVIKLYLSPIPGTLVSTVAHGDRTNCELPG
jgi:hypothetical protein